MADRATIFQAVQIGSESTPGTGVPANKRLTAMSFDMSSNPDVQVFRPTGSKYPTVASMTREWTTFSIDGLITYSEIVYALAGILKKVSPTGTTAKTWVFDPATYAGDTVATYTIEQGDGFRAHKVAYALITELGLSFSRDAVEISGGGIAQAIQDNIALTSTPTEIPLIPVLGHEIGVKLADSYAGLSGASYLSKAVSVDVNIGNRFGPAWFLNQSISFNAHVELEPEITVDLTLEADAEGMGLLSTMRAGSTKYMRIECIGPQIGAGPDTYLLQIDIPVKVVDVGDFTDVDGIYCIPWNMRAFHSSTLGGSGGAILVTVVNEVSAL